MTNYAPTENVIKSLRDATKEANGVVRARDSVHFSLNHPVQGHESGNWNDTKYAILMPFKATVKANVPGKFFGGTPVDLYTKGSVKIPEGSVIVRQSSTIPAGKLKITNAEAIEEFKTLKGVKVLETSGNVHEITGNAIEMMGYTKQVGNTYQMLGQQTTNIEELLKNKKVWEEFAKKTGLTTAVHTYTPNGRAEYMIDSIDLLAGKNSWIRGNIDYRKQFLEVISEIKGKSNSISFDINKLEEIIKVSQTPKEAINRIASDLKLKPIKPFSEYEQQNKDTIENAYRILNGTIPKETLEDIQTVITIAPKVGISKESKQVQKAMDEYFGNLSAGEAELINIDKTGINLAKSMNSGVFTI